VATGYVILAHSRPAQLHRLLETLGGAPVFLHVDSATSTDTFLRMTRGTAATVQVLPRVRSAWASWGIVEAVLHGLRAAVNQGVDHVAVMSGQDVLTTSPGDIDSFLAGYSGQSFAASWTLPAPHLMGPDGGWGRFRYRHRPVARRRLYLPIRRRLPAEEIRVGPLYQVLAATHAREVLKVTENRGDLVRFFRRVWIPDESYLPTVLGTFVPREQVHGDALWYQRWTPGSAHPHLLAQEDVPRLLSARAAGGDEGGPGRRKLFARKLDADADPALADALFGLSQR
jgi:hypothetical protein